MATYNVVPLTNEPDQKFKITIPVNGQNLTLNLEVRYNDIASYWVMTIKDISNNILLDSVPLLCGKYPAGDLLGQYQYLSLGSCYLVNLGSSTLDSPDDSTNSNGLPTLGTDFVLLWGPA